MVDEVRLQALHRAPPPPTQPTVSCETGRRTCSERQTWTEELCEIKPAYTLSVRSLVKHPLKGNEATASHIVGAEPSEAPTKGQWSELRRGHRCSKTTLTGKSQFHISIPLGFWNQVPHDGKQTGSPLDQWDMVWMKWDCRLSTNSWYSGKF